jgi:hypothetical protein
MRKWSDGGHDGAESRIAGFPSVGSGVSSGTVDAVGVLDNLGVGYHILYQEIVL